VLRSLFVNHWLDFSRLLFLALPHAVNRVIGRDAINPGSKIGSRLELSELLVRAQKRLLDHLFRIGPVPGHAISQPDTNVAVPLNENAEGVPVARQRSFDGDGVALGDGL